VQVGGPAAPAGGDAVADHGHDLVEGLAAEVAVGMGPAHQGVEVVEPPAVLGGDGGDLGHDLLGQDVERSVGGPEGVQVAPAHRRQQGGRLDQLVAGEREQAAPGHPVAGVVGPTDPLEEGGDAAGRAHLAHQLDGPDVDAQLQRGRGHQRPQLARPQAGLDPLAPVLGQGAVVGGHHVVAQALAQLVGQALGQAAGVDEHQGGVVLGHQGGDAVEHVAHLLGRRDRLQLALGQLQGQVEAAAVPGVDDGAGPGRPGPAQQVGHQLHGPLGGGEADALGPLPGGVLQPLQREGEVGAPLVAGHGMDLVDDDGLDRAEHGPAAGRVDQQVERLGRGDHEVRRPPHHRGPLARGGVAGAHAHPQLGRGAAQLGRHLGDLPQGALQVLGDVDGQRLERRHVGHLGPARHVHPPGVGPVEPVYPHQEPGQRLAGAGGRGDQRVVPGGDPLPALVLGGRGPVREPPLEPGGHRRVEPVRGHGRALRLDREQRQGLDGAGERGGHELSPERNHRV
jgi:hypothetical protein